MKQWKSLDDETSDMVSCPFCDEGDSNIDTYTDVKVEEGEWHIGDIIRCNKCQNRGFLDWYYNTDSCDPKWEKNQFGKRGELCQKNLKD